MPNSASLKVLPPATAVVDCHQAAVLGWMQEIAPYGIFTTDTDLIVRSWNEWLETHSGLAAPLAIGRPLLELFPDLMERKLEGQFRRALVGEVIVLSAAFHEYLLPFQPTVRDSGYAHMQQTARIAPLTFNGQLCGTITVIEDVTQRETQAVALARRHERDQLLSGCLAHLLRSRDPDSMARELFPEVARYLKVDTFVSYLLEPDGIRLRLHAQGGIEESEKPRFAQAHLGESICGRAAAERRLVYVNNVQESSDPNTARVKSLGLRAVVCHPLLVGDRLIGSIGFGAKTRDVFSAGDIEFIATISQYMAVALDRAISEDALRKAKQALGEHADNLEIRVRERTSALRDTIVQLESFSYTVAHDLRAPIRSLQAYSELLLDDPPEPVGDRARDYLSRIARAARRLDALTRDLLHFSSISRQDMQLSIVDPQPLLDEIQSLSPQIPKNALTIKAPLHPVRANAVLLQQCLSNLLDNARKFVLPGVEPRITIWTEPAPVGPSSQSAGIARAAFNPAAIPSPSGAVGEGRNPSGAAGHNTRRIRIRVQDNGIGVAPESREKIFGIFERLHLPEKYEGTGIGLAIVARAIQRMNGSCGVEPGVDQGSRFWLELPAAE